jgi:hypothetical protein
MQIEQFFQLYKEEQVALNQHAYLDCIELA